MKAFRQRRAPFLVSAGVVVSRAALFAEVAESVRENDTLVRVDHSVLDRVATVRSGWATTVARGVTTMGNVGFVIAVVMVAASALLLRRHRRHALFVAVSSGGAGVLVALTKYLVDRPRPPATHRLVTFTGEAFPSGHAAQGVACYMAIDVVGGWLLGAGRLTALVGLWLSIPPSRPHWRASPRDTSDADPVTH